MTRMPPRKRSAAVGARRKGVATSVATTNNDALALLTKIVRSLESTAGVLRAGEFPDIWASGDLVIDSLRWTVTLADKPVTVTIKEFGVLRRLLSARGAPVAREVLWSALGHDLPSSSRSLDAHIWTLRQKIETRPDRPKHLLTVMRYGYKLV